MELLQQDCSELASLCSKCTARSLLTICRSFFIHKLTIKIIPETLLLKLRQLFKTFIIGLRLTLFHMISMPRYPKV